MTLTYAPPTPSPGATTGTPVATVSVSPTSGGTLPKTGPSDAPWGILGAGVVLAIVGAALIARVRRSRA